MTVNPPDLFNYIAPQLRPQGDGRPPVKVDRRRKEIPEGKKQPGRNIILSAGVGFFFPGAGYRDINRRNTERVPGLK